MWHIWLIAACHRSRAPPASLRTPFFTPVVAASKRLRNAELKTAVSATPAFAADDVELPPPPFSTCLRLLSGRRWERAIRVAPLPMLVVEGDALTLEVVHEAVVYGIAAIHRHYNARVHINMILDNRVFCATEIDLGLWLTSI